MKRLSISLLILCTSFVSVAWSQQPACDASTSNSCADPHTNNIPQIQHVIVVIQENRTPTNLFHEDAKLVAKGAHVIPPNNQGVCGPILKNPVKSCTDANENTAITLTGLPLVTPVDPDHTHYAGFQCAYDNGAMDGACHTHVPKASKTSNISGCPGGGYQQYCPYTFVNNDAGILDPYFNIAEQYGFANWMFQTNQGPSQMAHLFLFSGTSAPVYNDGDKQKYWQWFAAENAGGAFGPGLTSGCNAVAGIFALQLPPAPPQNPPEQKGYAPPGATAGYPCYDHPTS
jgi:phospholipase C